jgi:hypothetical protein
MPLQFFVYLMLAIFYVSDDLGSTCRHQYYCIDQNTHATILPLHSLTYGPTCHPLLPSFLPLSSSFLLHLRVATAVGDEEGTPCASGFGFGV